MIRTHHLTLPFAFVSLAACAPDASEAPIVDTAEASQAALAPIDPIDPICRLPSVSVDPRRSLTVTDHNILVPASGGRDFSLRRVLAQLASQAGEPGGADELFKQLWDTQNPAPSLGLGFHCANSLGTPSVVNGFDYGCRAAEGAQITNASAKLDNYEAVALVNRFDLAPADGSNCGEYRIVFENGRNVGSRAFLIMEAVLPNPNPSCGIAACRPVQQMWANLTNISSASDRADDLEAFYFTGLGDFDPVVDYHHFLKGGSPCGYGTCATGQFRTNTFMQGPWMLKEFKLDRTCRTFIIKDPIFEMQGATLTRESGETTTALSQTICDLDFEPVSVKDNPFPDFFNPSSTHPLATDFVDHIDDQVACLAVNDVNRFGYCNLDDTYNHNESAAGFGNNDYRNQFSSGPSALRSSIQGALTSIGSSLTPENIVARAEALSCKGCHQHTNNASLGGGITFPASAAFVHNTEQVETGPDGQRFRISTALTGTFLPFRESVMESYLSQTFCVSCGSVNLSSALRTAEPTSAPAATTISGVRAIH